jgi:hypothetical protein
MFAKPMQIEKNVAKVEREESEYRIVVTVEHRNAEVITQDEAEIQLTKVLPLMFTQRRRY